MARGLVMRADIRTRKGAKAVYAGGTRPGPRLQTDTSAKRLRGVSQGSIHRYAVFEFACNPKPRLKSPDFYANHCDTAVQDKVAGMVTDLFRRDHDLAVKSFAWPERLIARTKKPHAAEVVGLSSHRSPLIRPAESDRIVQLNASSPSTVGTHQCHVFTGSNIFGPKRMPIHSQTTFWLCTLRTAKAGSIGFVP